MRSLARARRWRLAAAAALVACLVATDGFAIEMFTYFGDGSRIGLPSLEVPIEAYPGIPLRSDRLRARRRAMRIGPGAAVLVGPAGSAPGITIRSMPTVHSTTTPAHQALPDVVAGEPVDAPRPLAAPEPVAAPASEPPIAPEPEDEAPPAPVSPPSGS